MIQSLVADAVSRALDYLYKYRDTNDVEYKIVLQIHDAIILEVPIKHIEKVYDEVLPKCMTNLVDIWPSYLNGVRDESVKQPYHLGIGRDVYLYWGEYIPIAAKEVLNIQERFCNKKGNNNTLRDLANNPDWLPFIDTEALNKMA